MFSIQQCIIRAPYNYNLNARFEAVVCKNASACKLRAHKQECRTDPDEKLQQEIAEVFMNDEN